jgi:hypothetical protein
MMDFKTPDRSRYYDPRPTHRAPSRSVPPAEPAQPISEPPVTRKRRAAKPRGVLAYWKRAIVGLILIALIGWLAYGYITTKNQLEQAKNAPSSGSQSQQLENKVSLLVDLPQGETPTIATVNDASKLKNQAFFANAKDGDKVLIYSKAGKAVLYRPSTNRIIEYSTVNLGNSPTQ